MDVEAMVGDAVERRERETIGADWADSPESLCRGN
jgi:hypothetical protein